MGLMREIYAQLSDGEESVTGLSYTVWTGRGGYFQNVRKILLFSAAQIELSTPSGEVTVVGKDLTVRKYVGADLLLGGDIVAVTAEKGAKKG